MSNQSSENQESDSDAPGLTSKSRPSYDRRKLMSRKECAKLVQEAKDLTEERKQLLLLFIKILTFIVGFLWAPAFLDALRAYMISP